MRTRWLKNLSVVKPCWICLLIPTTMVDGAISDGLRELGYDNSTHDGVTLFTRITHESWYIPWQKTAALIDALKIAPRLQVAIVPGEERPSFDEAVLHQADVGEIAASNDQAWLIEALENEQLMCQFMPVVDLSGSTFGYESLVRAKRTDGSTANGGHIFNASRILRIEHLIDRHLHELSIRSFAAQNLPGFLFINLLPGFIQRPEFYLGGLGDACIAAGIDSKRIVLDCSNSENPRDIQHLKAIFKFCREKGYLCSLDDIESIDTVKRIYKEMKPDFIKLDMRVVQKLPDAAALRTLHDIVEFTRSSNVTLIAEGVETQETQDILSREGITLFQGYLYSPPEQVALTAPVAKKTRKAAL